MKKPPVQKKPPKTNKVSRTPRNISLMMFVILAGVSLVIMGIIQWQLFQYQSLITQRESILAGLASETTVTQEQVSALEDGYIAEEDVLVFIETVEKARPYFTNFEMRFISDVPEGSKAPYYLPVEFTMVGPRENVDQFVESLSHMPMVLRIVSVEMTDEDGFLENAEMIVLAHLYVADTFTP